MTPDPDPADARSLPTTRSTSRATISRWTTVRHPVAVLVAAAALALASQPALLPHIWWVQAITAGAAAAQAYGLAVLTGRLTRRLTRQRRHPANRTAVPAAVAVVGAGLLIAYPGQLAVAARTAMAAPPLLTQAMAVAGAVLVATALVRLARGVADAVRRHPRRAATLAVVPALVLATAGAAPAPHPEGAGAVGDKGREFLTMPDPTHATRIYVAKTAAPTPERRAELAVDELERAHGLDKSIVLIDVPTGSGWVNPQVVRSLEQLTAGDVATVVVQYAAHPSWWSYVKGGEGVQQSVRALVDEVDARVATKKNRPTVLIAGESLGAWGGLRAYGKSDDVINHVDGALWTGVPGNDPENDRTVSLIHADDPVPAWSPDLMWRDSPQWHQRWLPLASFWQATADVISAPATPEGYGHRYGEEVTDGWRHLLSTTPTYDSPL